MIFKNPHIYRLPVEVLALSCWSNRTVSIYTLKFPPRYTNYTLGKLFVAADLCGNSLD